MEGSQNLDCVNLEVPAPHGAKQALLKGASIHPPPFSGVNFFGVTVQVCVHLVLFPQALRRLSHKECSFHSYFRNPFSNLLEMRIPVLTPKA